MAISYPLNIPSQGGSGVAEIQISATNAIAVSKSPFTFATQVHAYDGEMWSASVSLPPNLLKELAEPWIAFLVSLRGQYGTFLLGDPNRTSPNGTATTLAVDGTIGERSITVASLNGTLKAGDYFQLGGGGGAKLYKILEDYSVADANAGVPLEIWPAMRASTGTGGDGAGLFDAKGVFRLSSNSTQWNINSSSAYGIQFDAMENI